MQPDSLISFDDFFDFNDDLPDINWDNRKRDYLEHKIIWEKSAECEHASPHLMYSTIKNIQSKVVNSYCKNCVVIKECLTISLINKEVYGVWGGSTESERALLIKGIENFIPDIYNEWSPEKEILLENAAWFFVERFWEKNEVDIDDLEIKKDELLKGTSFL